MHCKSRSVLDCGGPPPLFHGGTWERNQSIIQSGGLPNHQRAGAVQDAGAANYVLVDSTILPEAEGGLLFFKRPGFRRGLSLPWLAPTIYRTPSQQAKRQRSA